MREYLNFIRKMNWSLDHWLTVSFTLFAVIDVVGSIPVLIAVKEKHGGINEVKATLISGFLMILFLYVGESILKIMGVDIGSFAVAGSIVIFIIGLELVLGIEFFKSESSHGSGTVVPIAFPLIAGSGTLTTIMSLKANYSTSVLLTSIMVNLVVVFLVLKSLGLLSRILGPAALLAIRKFFGLILLAIAVKIFAANIGKLFPG